MSKQSELYTLIDGLITFEAGYEGVASPVALKAYLRQSLNQGIYHPVIAKMGGLDSPQSEKILDTFIASLPAPIQAVPIEVTAATVALVAEREAQRYAPVEVHCHRCRHTACRCNVGSDSFWLWWLLFSRPGVVHHHHHDRNNSDSRKNPVLEALIALTVFAVFASAILASIYLFGQIADIIERLANDEGTGYALTSLSWLLLSAGGSFTAATFLMAFIVLATAAANPVAWAIFGVIGFGLCFTALTHMLFPGLFQPISQRSCESTFGDASFVEKDLGRVQLTEAEEVAIEEKGADPLKVAMAIALLRREMGPDAIVNRYGFHAFFDATKRTQAQQANLDKIRFLRKGDFAAAGCSTAIIQIGNMTVDMNGEAPPIGGMEPSAPHEIIALQT